MADLDRKLFLGGRLKRLRYDLSLTQTQMAADLGVSASYLNHLERNQRPVTAQVLLKLASTYDLDLRTFTDDSEPAGEADLLEIFADPLFKDLHLPRREISELVAVSPMAAEAVTRLYRAYVERRKRDAVAIAPEDADQSPSDWVRDQIQTHHNFFPELDELGERLFAVLGGDPHGLAEAAQKRLAEVYRIDIRLMPAQVMMMYQRRFDPHRRRLMISETLGASSRRFAILYQLALSEYGSEVNALAEKARAPDLATQRLYKIALLNALAAATLMPYSAFLEMAEQNAYDIELLRAPFEVSWEQASQRLTTLSRPGARGVPFFLMRIDSAGNVSKRFAAGHFPFSRYGGACPRWNIHQAFQTPGRVITQVIETPDGLRYFTVSRTLDRNLSPYADGAYSQAAIGLGCELKYADKLIYARGLDLAQPNAVQTGPMCRLCERPNCRERAAPPAVKALQIDEWIKGVTAFPF
ncbi:DNA-binding protein [Asticcacaulis sp. AC466]|uniref:helix-turn-helix domain-containing protein n=1 Tax=Asticcacaulis sp. AC466 TaxID=1282362 RepID=UPI0003C3C90F|nr:helix-turn-helix transcriptional regulator [Asticcacaulis sp. AC466]ESQ84757.1 DNA-binding protein [Asticcacaulis sp. AC466]